LDELGGEGCELRGIGLADILISPVGHRGRELSLSFLVTAAVTVMELLLLQRRRFFRFVAPREVCLLACLFRQAGLDAVSQSVYQVPTTKEGCLKNRPRATTQCDEDTV
jgi:hypothetical protein